VKLTATVKLLPTDEQSAALLETVERVNAACGWLAERASEAGTANRYRLHALHYRDLRGMFGLSAQMAVRAIAKVCTAYKRDLGVRPSFRPRGAVAYDQRILSFRGTDRVSILTLGGRAAMPFAAGPRQLALLDEGTRGESKLAYRRGKWLLHVSVEVPDAQPAEPTGWLGADFGIVNLAVDSDGEVHSGAGVAAVHKRQRRLRDELQSAGTKSAKRHLVRLSGKEARFRSDVNHVISKRVVAKAKGTGRGIALEDLEGIRDRTTVRKAQRATYSGWSFRQLRSYVTYVGEREGVRVVAVDPRYTSQACPRCGHAEKANRRSQSEFLCKSCGFGGHADHVGAVNVARRAEEKFPTTGITFRPVGYPSRAAVNRPIVAVGCETTHKSLRPVASHRPCAGGS
jgi:IS605 OrfB family transposase